MTPFPPPYPEISNLSSLASIVPHSTSQVLGFETIIDVVSDQCKHNCGINSQHPSVALGTYWFAQTFTYMGKYACGFRIISPLVSLSVASRSNDLGVGARRTLTLKAGLPASLLACAISSWKSVNVILSCTVSSSSLPAGHRLHTRGAE